MLLGCKEFIDFVTAMNYSKNKSQEWQRNHSFGKIHRDIGIEGVIKLFKILIMKMRNKN